MRPYQVVLVDLGRTIGSEVNKTRPSVVLSPGEMNAHLKTVLIAPMTTTARPYPTRVKVRSGGKVGWVILDQIRTVDRARIMKTLGTLTTREEMQCRSVLREMLVDL